jgi:hypothetical protein
MPATPSETPQTEFTPPSLDAWEREFFAPPFRVKPIAVIFPTEEEVTQLALHLGFLSGIRAKLLSMADPESEACRRPCICFALRCANRVGIVRLLWETLIEAAAAGLPCEFSTAHNNAVHYAQEATHSAQAATCVGLYNEEKGKERFFPSDEHRDRNLIIEAAANAAIQAMSVGESLGASDNARKAHVRVMLIDIARLRATGSDLAGWDDPRLGPLWPDGPVEWASALEQQLREWKQKLANRPNPFAPPISEETRKQFADHQAINELATQGAFDGFRGEYVVVFDGKLVGHGPDLKVVRQEAAEKCGVPLSRLAYRFIY